ncbi:MAG: N-acetylmuramoyl-L-alanine amidase [Kofleriaceae bacterium]
MKCLLPLVIAGAFGSASAGEPTSPATGEAPTPVLATPTVGARDALPVGAAVRTVVIDPGHGGSNPGTRGAGLHEKQLTLAISNLVAERLRARGITVVLTRADDRTLTLRQRVAIADRTPADIFVSIHANASPERIQRGYETFVLTARGIDIDGRALRSDTVTPRSHVDPDIALVLDDVERGAAQWEAADLASRVQRNLRDRRGAAGDRGVRQDAHHVLLGATMPAILVEVGFLDHPLEGRELAQPATQTKLADAIADAVIEQLAEL